MIDDEISKNLEELVKKLSLTEGLHYLKDLKPYLSVDNVSIIGDSIEKLVNNLLEDNQISRTALIKELKAIIKKVE